MEERGVIVILTDSMRVDHLGCYGNPWARTPNIGLYRRRGRITTPRPGQYSPERDVYERDNVTAEEPEVARRMERQLREFLNSLLT